MRLPAFLIAVILIAGCNSSQNESTKHLPKTHIVEIKGMKFIPENMEVSPGDSVKWINKDIVAHNVTEEPSKAWGSPDLKPGESFITEVNTAGSYKCTLHPVMEGKISLSNN